MIRYDIVLYLSVALINAQIPYEFSNSLYAGSIMAAIWLMSLSDVG